MSIFNCEGWESEAILADLHSAARGEIRHAKGLCKGLASVSRRPGMRRHAASSLTKKKWTPASKAYSSIDACPLDDTSRRRVRGHQR